MHWTQSLSPPPTRGPNLTPHMLTHLHAYPLLTPGMKSPIPSRHPPSQHTHTHITMHAAVACGHCATHRSPAAMHATHVQEMG